MSDADISGDGWVTVRTCVWGHQADLIRSVLEGSDMEVFIPDEQMSSLRPHLLLGTGGVRVQVRASSLERAQELLASFDATPAVPAVKSLSE